MAAVTFTDATIITLVEGEATVPAPEFATEYAGGRVAFGAMDQILAAKVSKVLAAILESGRVVHNSPLKLTIRPQAYFMCEAKHKQEFS